MMCVGDSVGGLGDVGGWDGRVWKYGCVDG